MLCFLAGCCTCSRSVVVFVVCVCGCLLGRASLSPPAVCVESVSCLLCLSCCPVAHSTCSQPLMLVLQSSLWVVLVVCRRFPPSNHSSCSAQQQLCCPFCRSPLHQRPSGRMVVASSRHRGMLDPYYALSQALSQPQWREGGCTPLSGRCARRRVAVHACTFLLGTVSSFLGVHGEWVP